MSNLFGVCRVYPVHQLFIIFDFLKTPKPLSVENSIKNVIRKIPKNIYLNTVWQLGSPPTVAKVLTVGRQNRFSFFILDVLFDSFTKKYSILRINFVFLLNMNFGINLNIPFINIVHRVRIFMIYVHGFSFFFFVIPSKCLSIHRNLLHDIQNKKY